MKSGMTGCRLKFRAHTAGCGCHSGAQSQNRESQRCNRVRIAVERLAKTNYSITKRNPTTWLRSVGVLPLRLADRTGSPASARHGLFAGDVRMSRRNACHRERMQPNAPERRRCRQGRQPVVWVAGVRQVPSTQICRLRQSMKHWPQIHDPDLCDGAAAWHSPGRRPILSCWSAEHRQWLKSGCD